MLPLFGVRPNWWDITPCSGSIGTPVDSTKTVPAFTTYCDSGAIVIDSVAVGSGIVVVDGFWRLT
jgi:hypothetical protein